ncbi:hypothetical protein EIL87_04490 [Saccharopolyspora rhizosphaerae]|uniref:Uncharacterized protein n=1 Tax=Saccharopolyspora rhizosphaerae TaxID=2492662 RepID=A0A3R8VKL1_9PSEU|nr:hypothetical protein EIL87_04490 [Saccharopolyspora rhizosphaerae]
MASDDIDQLRASTAHLVRLDGESGGTALVPVAARAFREASARLAAGNVPSSLEADCTATVAELGEVAAWLAFDAGQHGRARRLSSAALRLARRAGDTSMELFLLGNLALMEQETGRARDALRTVELVERLPLSPRVRIMTALRRARATASLGDERAAELLHRARTEVGSSVRSTDPAWAWWVDLREVTHHEAGVWSALGRPDRAVDCYAAALDAAPDDYPWASYLAAAHLVSVLVEVRSWAEAERAAAQVAALATGVRSARASARLRDAALAARRSRAPGGLDDLLIAFASR